MTTIQPNRSGGKKGNHEAISELNLGGERIVAAGDTVRAVHEIEPKSQEIGRRSDLGRLVTFGMGPGPEPVLDAFEPTPIPVGCGRLRQAQEIKDIDEDRQRSPVVPPAHDVFLDPLRC